MEFNQMKKLSPDEAKDLLKYFIETNVKLEKEGKPVNTVSLLGHAGIAKTSTVVQIAKELDIDIQIIRLSNIDGAEELIGFPVTESLMEKKGDDGKFIHMWVRETNYQESVEMGFKHTGKQRTSYAPPAWLTELNTNPSILLIDDYNRGSARFMQALMSIVNERSYYSWELPEGCQVMLTGNPIDEGEYQVSHMDMAQKSRFFEFGFKFDIESWAKYAVENNIDSRCINFMLGYYNEVLFGESEAHMVTNPRQWTKFFNAIKYIEDFQKPSSLMQIQTIGSGIVPEGINMFTTFINQKLDQLPEAEWIMTHPNEKAVLNTLYDIIGELKKETGYKPEIASIVSTRVVLWLLNYFKDNPVTEEHVDRLELLFKEKVFSKDLEYRISREIMSSNREKYRIVKAKLTKKLMRRSTFKAVFNSTIN